MNKRERLIFVCLLIALMVVVYHPLKWKFFPPGGPVMDTSNWKTYCAGRFLIDIPLSARIRDAYGQIWGEDLVWREDLTPETARLEAAAEIEKLKNIKHEKTAGSMFIGTVDLPGGGIAIVKWMAVYSTVAIEHYCYFITPEPYSRVFTYVFPSGADRRATAQKRMEYLASTLRGRNDEEIPSEPGFCFPGGISVHTGEWRSERAGFGIELPAFPGITFGLDIWGMGIQTGKLSSQFNSFEFAAEALIPGNNYLRNGEVMLGEIAAEEIAITQAPLITKRPETSYYFKLRSPCLGKRLDRPRIHFVMNNQLHPESDPFSSTDEALSLWDAISRSIRLRPGAI
jgi:hypothetical protein